MTKGPPNRAALLLFRHLVEHFVYSSYASRRVHEMLEKGRCQRFFPVKPLAAKALWPNLIRAFGAGSGGEAHATDRRVFVRAYPVYGKRSPGPSAQLFLPHVPASLRCARLGLGQLSARRGHMGWSRRCARALAVVRFFLAGLLSALWVDLGRGGRCANHRSGQRRV